MWAHPRPLVGYFNSKKQGEAIFNAQRLEVIDAGVIFPHCLLLHDVSRLFVKFRCLLSSIQKIYFPGLFIFIDLTPFIFNNDALNAIFNHYGARYKTKI